MIGKNHKSIFFAVVKLLHNVTRQDNAEAISNYKMNGRIVHFSSINNNSCFHLI